MKEEVSNNDIIIEEVIDETIEIGKDLFGDIIKIEKFRRGFMKKLLFEIITFSHLPFIS